MQPTFTKSIKPVFTTEGRRRLLVGFDGFLNDEKVVFCRPTARAVEEALNAAAYEQLVAEADLDAEIDEYSSEVYSCQN